ncbi:MAG: hypothetical protein EOP04_29505, partial [Proteobacteria bacterium]
MHERNYLVNKLVCLLQKKKDLSEKVSKLSKKECLDLFRIIRARKVKYTENQNGCYVNIGPIDNDIIDEIKHFVDICLDFHAKNHIREQQMREFSQEFESY